MGSWNHTCMVSQMHITDGEEVVEVWLAQPFGRDRDGINHYTYSTDVWTPYPILMYGEYTDYGKTNAGHDLTNPRNALLLELIKRDIVEREQGENQVHDHAVVKEGLTFERLHTIDHGGRGQVRGWSEQYRALKHAVIKRSMFDKIINDFYLEEARWKDRKNRKGYYVEKIYFKDIIKNLAADVKWVRDYLKNNELPERFEQLHIKDRTAAQIKESFMVSGGISRLFWGDDTAPLFTQYLNDDEGSLARTAARVNYFNNYDFKNLTDEELTHHIEEHLKFQWLAFFINLSRKMWSPQVGQGSQSQEYHPYELLSEFYIEDIKAQKARWDDEDIGELQRQVKILEARVKDVERCRDAYRDQSIINEEKLNCLSTPLVWLPAKEAPPGTRAILKYKAGFELAYLTNQPEGFIDTWRYLTGLERGVQAPWPDYYVPLDSVLALIE